MPRSARVAPGGVIFHVLNRANGRRVIFEKDEDYRAFERVLAGAIERVPMRLLAYCVMPNHWHLVVWPERDGKLAAFMHLLTTTHVRRWHQHRHTVGTGHLYQGVFKSFPVQEDGHLLTVCRYVERNPLQAALVGRAEDWEWSSLSARLSPADVGKPPLTDWPVPVPDNWSAFVNEALTETELQAVRRSAQRGCPYGTATWQERVAGQLGLESTLRPRGRPRGALPGL